MHCLRELLKLVEPAREVWYAPGRGTVCAGDIARFIERSEAVREQVRGRQVALHAVADEQFAPLLVLLDGACRQITLLPTDLTPDRLAAILARSGSEILVAAGQQTLPLGSCAVLPVDVAPLWNPSGSEGQTGCQAEPRNQSVDQPTAVQGSRWVLPTSGTTGVPKLVAHTLASLTRSAKGDLSRGREYRWGSLYNLTGFAGLQVFLQSWCGGSCLILGRQAASLSDRVADLIAGGCTALSATPTMWRKLLMACPVAVEKLQLRQITLGGEIIDQKILDALRHVFPDARITHIYASTEAGVGFAVRDGLAGFPASYLDHPPRGMRLAVGDQGQLLLRADCGEQEYVDGTAQLKRADGFVDTGDLVTRRGDRFYFLGRANGTINVGGNKVHPEEVEGCLLGCAGVQFARVTRRKSPFTGELVQAEVVPHPNCGLAPEELKKTLLARCRAELAPYKVPAVVKLVAELEATASGKLKRAEEL